MVNVIIIGIVVSFLCLLAIVISCVQRHTNTSDEQLARPGEQTYDKLKGTQQEDAVISRHNIGQMLAKGVSRKYLFNGNPKNVISPSRKYCEHATPIFEDSQE